TDRCDAECRIEPCWDCFDDPSLCQPTAESLACKDSNPCMTDEFCTVAGACERSATTRRQRVVSSPVTVQLPSCPVSRQPGTPLRLAHHLARPGTGPSPRRNAARRKGSNARPVTQPWSPRGNAYEQARGEWSCKPTLLPETPRSYRVLNRTTL